MANQRGDVYLVTNLNLESINDILTRIAERFDKLEGLRGEVEIKDKVSVDTAIKYVDENGTVIHGFGDA